MHISISFQLASLLSRPRSWIVILQTRSLLHYMKSGGKEHVIIYFFIGTVGSGSPGWTLSTSLDSTSLYVSTRASSKDFRKCPVGIQGAYDRDVTLDPSFSVQCHSDSVQSNCCLSVSIHFIGLSSLFQYDFHRFG